MSPGRRIAVRVAVIVAALAVTLPLAGLPVSGLLAVPAASAQPHRTGAGCAATLDCRAADFDAMPMAQRVEFVRSLHAVLDTELTAGFARWNNIRGITEFWRDDALGPPGSWVSTVNAAILEGIERGAAIALGRSTDTFDNPGAVLWADYLLRLRDGELAERAAHDRAWGIAEQASTDHGTTTAANRGLTPTAVESRFFLFTESYRWALRNRPVAFDVITTQVDLIRPGLGVPFYDWWTDVSNLEAAYRSARTGYRLAELNAVDGGLSGLDLIIAYLPALLAEFEQVSSSTLSQSVTGCQRRVVLNVSSRCNNEVSRQFRR